jgi:hypothetical protein
MAASARVQIAQSAARVRDMLRPMAKWLALLLWLAPGRIQAQALPEAASVQPQPPAAVLVQPPQPMAAPPDARTSSLTLSAWMHMSNRVQNLGDPQRLNRFSQENELDVLLNAQIVEQVAMTASLVGAYGPTSPTDGSLSGSLAILDLIAKLDLHDALHLWAGRMIVPSDRSNFSGPWFMAPWYYPGRFYGPTSAGQPNNFFGTPIGPRQGPKGRNDGATIWGQLQGGLLKYYAGAYELYDSTKNPLLSGRLNLALINPEPGYYQSSTYYGTKDILALAIAGQYQKSKAGAADYSEFNADLLFEKNLHGAGTVDLEGAFYKYFGDVSDYSYFLLASYLTPSAGPGGVQPLLRFQQAKPRAGTASWNTLDAQLGYVVDAYAVRFALGYQYSSVAGLKGNALYLGVQLQK